jgi:hypothetical protein
MKHYLITFIAFIALFISGCAETLTERQSVSVDIVPLKHTYSVELKEKEQGFVEVEHYIDSNWLMLAESNVELVVLSPAGDVISAHVRELFKKKGKDPSQITQTVKEQNSEFDFQLVSTSYKTFTPVCKYYQIGYFGETDTGCYAEGARWKAMSNPEKMMK